MDNNLIVQIAIIGTFGLLGLGLGAVVLAGIKSLMQGKQDFKKMAIIALPFAIFGIGYATLGEAVKAGVLTTLIMMAIMAIMIAFTGLRGTFKS